jgi:CubicO group peptidase (beta-lactamase class C family)
MSASGGICSGHVAPGFERVALEFERNFTLRGDIGAAFSAVVEGEVVVDLWGGLADSDSGREWGRDSVQVIFSGTKGMVAACLALLLDRGRLSLDVAVSEYWPAFAAGGKERITVGQAASHLAGIPAITEPLKYDDLLDLNRMTKLTAEQPPIWGDERPLVYHALTYGWICGGLIEAISGSPVGEFFSSEIAQPLRLNAWIGLPAAEEERVTRLSVQPTFVGDPTPLDRGGEGIYRNPPILTPPLIWNDPEVHRAEIPGAGGIADARSMAKFYGALVHPTKDLGSPLISREALCEVTRPLAQGVDRCFGDPLAFGAGFQLQTDQQLLGPSKDAFGHGGAGGSIHGAWPSLNAGFSFCMNQLRDEPTDRRAAALLEELHAAVTTRTSR